jgi:hypothetical protein
MSACGTRNAGLLFLAPQVLITAEGEPGPLGSPAHTEPTSSASGLPKSHGAACGVALSDEKLVAIAKILRGTYGHLCELNRFPAGASAAMLHIPNVCGARCLFTSRAVRAVCMIYFRVQTSSSHTISHSQSHVRAPMTGSSMSHRRHPFVMT